MQNSSALWTNSSHYYQLCSCSLRSSLCFGCLSCMTSVVKASNRLFLLLTLWICDSTKMNSYFEIEGFMRSVCKCKRSLSMCLVSKFLQICMCSWFLRVLSVLIHSSSCMHSCDVSLCVGSRGAWSEVHVGQYGSAVVMTIILLITVLHKKVIWGVREGVVVLFSEVSSFALHGRAAVTVGLNCCDHQEIL